MKDFFISYNRNDRQWAEWIAVNLTNSGLTVAIQSWDFLPGSNFVLQMHQATMGCKRTLAVLSPDWLASVFTQPEWAAALASDPASSDRKLVPVRVKVCEPPGLLRGIVYCDLVGLGEDDAREELLRGVREAPGTRPSSSAFPGAAESVPRTHLPNAVQCAFDLYGLLQTTRTTFAAQTRLRNSLVQRIRNRLSLDPNRAVSYEEFFSAYYPDLDAEERRTFSTIRSFTASILSVYNRRILETVEGCPEIAIVTPGISALKQHLLLWLAKFEGVFLHTPSMCLLYVGVAERVPFPPDLDRNLWQFLNGQAGFRNLLHGEPEPMEEFDEGNDGSGSLQS